jgi:hypothetical protein
LKSRGAVSWQYAALVDYYTVQKLQQLPASGRWLIQHERKSPRR